MPVANIAINAHEFFMAYFKKEGGETMKKTIILLTVVALVLVAGSAFAGIATTKHNLTSGNATSSIHDTSGNATLCGFCHIPHGGSTAVAGLPLWGRQTPTTSYAVYGGSGAALGNTLSGTTINQPGAFSLTCLSCHDGTLAIGVNYKNGALTASYPMAVGAGELAGYLSGNNLAFIPNTAYNPMINEAGAGGGLQNDHPVGMTYRGVAATAAGLTDIATASGLGFKFFNEASGNDQMECATCHDPHTDLQIKFLRVAPANLCQDCHANK